jgi:glycolate oxidase FAD binding subunit
VISAPASVEEAAEILTALAAERRTVTIAGGETALDLGNAGAPVDATVSTLRLERLVDYAPADQVVTVEAGISLKSLQELLLPHRQRLSLDPPLPERATLGGIVATNAYGPRRTRYGTVKDLILGMTIVRPDGAIARGGGKVVKNVAGFDVPKLMVGSLGTLAMIATVTLRLHPLPEAERALYFAACSPADVRVLLADAVAAQLEPAIVLGIGNAQGYGIGFRFEGFAAGVDAQIAALNTIATRRELRAEELSPADWLAVDAAHDAARTAGTLRVKIAAAPAEFEAVHELAIAPLVARLDIPVSAVYPAVGAAFVSGVAADETVVEGLAAARRAVEARGGSLVVTAAPAALRERFEAWGTPPASLELMKALKLRFDPNRRFNPGRFVGGL